jgi:hypothetical protein
MATPRAKSPSPKFRHVNEKSKGQFYTRICKGRDEFSLGPFTSAEAAARGADLMQLALDGPGAITNFDPANYTEAEVQISAVQLELPLHESWQEEQEQQQHAGHDDRLRAAPTVGSRVSVHWPAWGQWFEGTVIAHPVPGDDVSGRKMEGASMLRVMNQIFPAVLAGLI